MSLFLYILLPSCLFTVFVFYFYSTLLSCLLTFFRFSRLCCQIFYCFGSSYTHYTFFVLCGHVFICHIWILSSFFLLSICIKCFSCFLDICFSYSCCTYNVLFGFYFISCLSLGLYLLNFFLDLSLSLVSTSFFLQSFLCRGPIVFAVFFLFTFFSLERCCYCCLP